MTITATYSAAHAAYAIAASAVAGITPFDVRVLVALYERNGIASSQEIAHDLQDEGTQVRRSSLALRSEFVAVDAVDGGRPRPGIVTRLQLTDRGRHLAESAIGHFRNLTEPLS